MTHPAPGRPPAYDSATRRIVDPDQALREGYHALDEYHGSRDEQDRADGEEQPALGEPAAQPGAPERTGHRRGGADAEQRPVDAARRVPGHPRDPHAEPHHQVGADGARGRLAHVADERWHPKRSEDQA